MHHVPPRSLVARSPLVRAFDPPPFDYLIDPAIGRVLVVVRELADPATHLRAAARIFDDAEFDRSFDIVIDCERLATLPDSNVVLTFAYLWSTISCDATAGRWAIVTSSACAYGLARMF